MHILPTGAPDRKKIPIYSGVMMYFPRAMVAIAECSQAGNEQHHPDKPLHWDRDKSGDELDALVRHLMEAGEIDDDGILHSTKLAWRALANLEKELEIEESLQPATIYVVCSGCTGRHPIDEICPRCDEGVEQ